ncbi:MAG: DUF4440 domain-containing protein [Pseudomonadota bacterium]
MSSSDNTQDLIRELEESLLSDRVRKSEERLAEFLSDDFEEFTSIGTSYDKDFALRNIPKQTGIRHIIEQSEVRLLSSDIALITYRAVSYSESAEPAASLRSSLWRRTDDRWQMVFHQGTRVTT